MDAKRMVLVAGAAMIMAGCGSIESSVETSEKVMVQTEIQITGKEESIEEIAAEARKGEKVSPDDNFSVEMEIVEEFAGKIKTVVTKKDLEALADLTIYTIYVRFPDGGKSIENREALIALGADLEQSKVRWIG